LPADYEVLAERGVDVKGKIMIARYGHSWRGIKPKMVVQAPRVGGSGGWCDDAGPQS
jgi:N-acetylated-alpha-linked acidic dipeptidase